ncbi:MAG: type II toxin-antitoxin system RelE/ParE family toxin [Phascolarctobacterium sp.]|nr:type II toxin-antitoxin system RelE/ParE family toxin [Phascolarctobacterium sp.]
MMKYNTHITKKAKQDMVEAADYIEFTLLNPDAADALLDKAEAEMDALSEFPKRNKLVDDAILASCGIRFIVINNYLAFYVISEEDATVHFIRFLYAKRNWAHILKQGYSLD